MCEKLFLQNQPEKPNLINKHFRTWAIGGAMGGFTAGKEGTFYAWPEQKGVEGWCGGDIFHEEHHKLGCSSVGRVSY